MSRLTLMQSLFTIFLYLLGIIFLGLALWPAVLLIAAVTSHVADLSIITKTFILSITFVSGYFLFGISFIFVAGIARVLLGLSIPEGTHKIGSLVMIRWMMASSLLISVRFVFLDFMLLTPFSALFYKLMGARLGKNVQINSTRVGDLWHLNIGDYAVIGGNATVICHAFEKEGLKVKKVKIGRKAIIGLNAIVLPGCEIGDKAVIAAGAVLPKDTIVPAGTVYYGPEKST